MSRLSNADLNLVADDADVELVDCEPRVIGPFAIANAEAPGVPRASDVAFLIEVAAAERCAHVRAEIIDREIISVLLEYGHDPLADLERPAFAFRDVADSGDGGEIIR